MKTFEEIFIKEQDFAETMEGKVLPFIREHSKTGYLTSHDGLQIYYQTMINPEEKASIVICHGYCEFTTKYTETMYYFYQMGYSVFIMDHRGHGLSDRQVEGFSKVHVNHFSDYVQDFDDFIRKVVMPESLTDRYILFAHSMGGAIGALYLEKYHDVFEKAILTSPMIELSTGSTNKLIVKLLCFASYFPFMKTRYLPGHHEYDHTFKYPRCSCLSKARYTFHYNEREREPHYRSNGATFGWSREAFNVSKKILKNANLIEIPVIIMQASLDTLVMPGAQNAFSRLAKDCQVRRFEGSKHEIFNATDDIIVEYYNTVFRLIR